MRPDYAGNESLIVFKLRHGGLLLAFGVTAVLHGGHYTSLFPFWYTAEAYSYKREKHGPFRKKNIYQNQAHKNSYKFSFF